MIRLPTQSTTREDEATAGTIIAMRGIVTIMSLLGMFDIITLGAVYTIIGKLAFFDIKAIHAIFTISDIWGIHASIITIAGKNEIGIFLLLREIGIFTIFWSTI
jgi:hypothetical protein